MLTATRLSTPKASRQPKSCGTPCNYIYIAVVPPAIIYIYIYIYIYITEKLKGADNYYSSTYIIIIIHRALFSFNELFFKFVFIKIESCNFFFILPFYRVKVIYAIVRVIQVVSIYKFSRVFFLN
jgi:hypothetical protein